MTAPSSSPGAPGEPDVISARAWLVLILAATSSVLPSMNLSIMNVVYRDVQDAFPDVSAAQLSWVLNAYTVVSAATLVIGGAVLSGVLSQVDPAQADDAALFVMLAECIGAGMLAPLALQRLARLLRRVAGEGVARLAVDNVEMMARPLSGALVPLVLAAAFTTVKIAVHTTTARVTGLAGPAADVWTDYSGTAIYASFAAVAARSGPVSCRSWFRSSA